MSKDLSSTSEAEQITSPTAPDRESSLASDWTVHGCIWKEKETKRKTGSDFIPECLKHPCSPLAYDHMQYLVLQTPAPTPPIKTARDVRDWTLLDDGRLWCNVAALRKQDGCLSAYGHLKWRVCVCVCVRTLSVSLARAFFRSRLFWRRFTFQENRPFIFFVLISTGFTWENSLSRGLLLKEFIYWFI